MPADSGDLKDQKYKDVTKKLTNAGFTNIETKALGDLVTGWLSSPGEVEEVAVAGDSSFRKGDSYDSEVPIVVTYHSFPKERNGSSASKSASGDPSSASSMMCNTEYGHECTFGQTAIYSRHKEGGELRLEITVMSPVRFKPGKGAEFLNYFASKQKAMPVNIYFPVTIKNVSKLPLESDFVFVNGTNRDEGDYDVLSVEDGNITSTMPFKTLEPGESVSIKSGWSMSTLDGVQAEVDIDGLQGYSITFVR